MWNVDYKRHNVFQSWFVLGNYSNKERALIHASRALSYYFMIKVTDTDGSVIMCGFPIAVKTTVNNFIRASSLILLPKISS